MPRPAIKRKCFAQYFYRRVILVSLTCLPLTVLANMASHSLPHLSAQGRRDQMRSDQAQPKIELLPPRQPSPQTSGDKIDRQDTLQTLARQWLAKIQQLSSNSASFQTLESSSLREASPQEFALFQAIDQLAAHLWFYQPALQFESAPYHAFIFPQPGNPNPRRPTSPQ